MNRLFTLRIALVSFGVSLVAGLALAMLTPVRRDIIVPALLLGSLFVAMMMGALSAAFRAMLASRSRSAAHGIALLTGTAFGGIPAAALVAVGHARTGQALVTLVVSIAGLQIAALARPASR